MRKTQINNKMRSFSHLKVARSKSLMQTRSWLRYGDKGILRHYLLKNCVCVRVGTRLGVATLFIIVEKLETNSIFRK